MKIIKYIEDKALRIRTGKYQLPSGLVALHTVDKDSNEFSYSVMVRAGVRYEQEIGLPNGTAHLLEHIIQSNLKEQIETDTDAYYLGNRNRPSISKNASTGREFIKFYAYGHYKGAERIIRLVNNKLIYRKLRLEKNIKKEKKIVLSEISQKPKRENNIKLNYRDFLYNDYDPLLSLPIIGDSDSVTKITKQDLEKHMNTYFSSDRVIVASKGPTPLTPTIKKEIYRLDDSLSNKKSPIIENRIFNVKDNFKYHYFQDFNSSGINVSLNFLSEKIEPIDYDIDRRQMFARNFFTWTAHEYLREEKHLIYGFDNDISNLLDNVINREVEIFVNKDMLAEALEELYKFMYEDIWISYLKDGRGRAWLENVISSYIFSLGFTTSRWHSESVAFDLVFEREKFDYYKARKAARKVRIKDLEAAIKELYINTTPLVWLSSAEEGSEILEIFKSSRLYKRFAN